MKKRLVLCLLLSIVSTACSKPAGNADTALQARNTALFDRAEKAQDESHQRNMQLIERTESLIQTQEEMLKRQQDDFAHFERILDTWEKQQAQYQRYLDTLPPKK